MHIRYSTAFIILNTMDCDAFSQTPPPLLEISFQMSTNCTIFLLAFVPIVLYLLLESFISLPCPTLYAINAIQKVMPYPLVSNRLCNKILLMHLE